MRSITDAATSDDRKGSGIRTLPEFERLFRSLLAWSRYQDDLDRGALAGITASAVVDAASLVGSGTVVPLGHEITTQASIDAPQPATHRMTRVSETDTLGAEYGDSVAINVEHIGMEFHGKTITHLDALAHFAFQGEMFGGLRPEDVIDGRGARRLSVRAAAEGIVGRGVLLDVPGHRGVGWLEPGEAIGADELRAVAAAQNVDVRSGDILLVRTGHGTRRASLGAWDCTNLTAGLDIDVGAQLVTWDVAVLGGDGDSDARPTRVPGVHSPIHVLSIVALGIALLDNLSLDRLATTCRSVGRWEFLCVVAPLGIPGGTGSPVNPIAIL